EDNNTLEVNQAGYCLGYFWAVIRWNETGRTRSSLCVRQRVTVDELRKVFLKYMNDYPEKLDEDADLMVWEALMGPFACKDSLPEGGPMMTDERFANLMAELIAGLEPEAPGQPPRAAGAARTIFFS